MAQLVPSPEQNLATAAPPAMAVAVEQLAQLPAQAWTVVPLLSSHQALQWPLRSAETQARHLREDEELQACQGEQLVMAAAGAGSSATSRGAASTVIRVIMRTAYSPARRKGIAVRTGDSVLQPGCCARPLLCLARGARPVIISQFQETQPREKEGVMRGMALVVVLLALPLAAHAQKETGKMKHGSMETMDCARMIKNKAPIAAKLSELMTQMADTFEAHAKWIRGNKDAASRTEAQHLNKLVKEQRAAAASLKKLASQMESASFEAAPHDVSKMDPAINESMTEQVRLQREVADLLRKDAAAIEKSVAAGPRPKKASR